MPTRLAQNTRSLSDAPFRLRYRFSISFGATDPANNELYSPGSTGSKLDLKTFDTYSSPTTSSSAAFEYFHSDRLEFYAFLNPLKVRDEDSFATSKIFAGTVFPTRCLDNHGLYHERNPCQLSLKHFPIRPFQPEDRGRRIVSKHRYAAGVRVSGSNLRKRRFLLIREHPCEFRSE